MDKELKYGIVALVLFISVVTTIAVDTQRKATREAWDVVSPTAYIFCKQHLKDNDVTVEEALDALHFVATTYKDIQYQTVFMKAYNKCIKGG